MRTPDVRVRNVGSAGGGGCGGWEAWGGCIATAMKAARVPASSVTSVLTIFPS
jgi:hypothetical protein